MGKRYDIVRKAPSAGQLDLPVPDLSDVDRDLRERGYQTVFQHKLGAGNIFTLYVSFSDGDELLTVSRPPMPPFIDGVGYRGTEIYRLNPITFKYLRSQLGLEPSPLGGVERVKAAGGGK